MGWGRVNETAVSQLLLLFSLFVVRNEWQCAAKGVHGNGANRGILHLFFSCLINSIAVCWRSKVNVCRVKCERKGGR